MENNEHLYKIEYENLLNQNKLLGELLEEKKREIEKQERLLEECWERIYYKSAWLTLSNENIDGMKKHIERMKKTGAYDNLMMLEGQ